MCELNEEVYYVKAIDIMLLLVCYCFLPILRYITMLPGIRARGIITCVSLSEVPKVYCGYVSCEDLCRSVRVTYGL